MPQALSAFLAMLLALQGGSPASMRKTDLVRLLSGAGMSPTDLSQLVRRNCLTFEPSERDRNDLRRLGAVASLFAAVDECARRKAPRRKAARWGRVGPARRIGDVIGSIGVVEKQVAFNVAAGPAAQLLVLCGASSVSGHFAIRPDGVIALRVFAQEVRHSIFAVKCPRHPATNPDIV